MHRANSLLRAAIQRSAAKARQSGAGISDDWSVWDLGSQVGVRSLALARAEVLLLGVRGGGRCFVEPGVSIAGRAHLTMGSGCVLERGVHIRAFGSGGLVIGNGVTIGRYSVVEVSSGLASTKGEIRVGDGVGISDHCFLGGAGGLHIGAETIVGQGVSFHPENHGTGMSRPIKTNPLSHAGIRIGNGCWIGAGARILDGVSIGDNTTIGAGSVVTHSIPANSVAFGVPARVHKG